jgi:hypothetical protein
MTTTKNTWLQVFDGTSDVGIGDIGFLHSRFKMVDYTVSIYQMENGFISRKPAPLERYKVHEIDSKLGESYLDNLVEQAQSCNIVYHAPTP